MVPFGKDIYYALQRNITGKLRQSDVMFVNNYRSKVHSHEGYIEKYGKTKREAATFFEFGAGWDLLAPIGFSVMGGVRRYIVVDINKYMREENVLKCLNHYAVNVEKLAEISGIQMAKIKPDEILNSAQAYRGNIDDFLSRSMNIEYIAPCDAGDMELETGSVDYVISNFSMEHIPRNDIYRILRECHRILASDGMLSVTIDYSDHWAHADRSLNPYSYMRYSDFEWEKYNPPMHYQNRLRHSDYRRIISENGFEIIEEKPETPGEEAVSMLKSIKLSEKFRTYDFDDLLITNAQFVARRV